jgi:hypothetical protein
MLVGPALQGRWLTHLLLQLCLLNAMLMTLKVNPEWGRTRGITVELWLLALAGSLIAFAPVPDAWERLARGAETMSLLPLLVLLAAGILRFVYRSRRLTIDGVFATVVVYMIVAIVFRGSTCWSSTSTPKRSTCRCRSPSARRTCCRSTCSTTA